jgi:adenylyltransferase/sulfurtransferase
MADDVLSPREARRYQKQIMIPGIGIKGQEKIKNASVLVIGAGGLGCPVLQYLSAAGVGKIGVAEFDTVNETNLQRQVLYGTDDIGKLKSIIAKNRLEHLNSNVAIEIINLKIDSFNSLNIFKKFDIIVDATDNLESRYAINDSCVLLKKPMVHGAIYLYEGQVSVFNFKGGPDYRSYNPEVKISNSRDPKPSDVGLFGVVPCITGAHMANEVLKMITGTGTVLNGMLLLINTLDNTFRLIKIISDKKL